MLYATLPLPDPPVDPVSVIHPALLTAVHAQPTPLVTVTLPVAALDETVRLAGEIPGTHGAVNEKPFEAVLAVAPPGPSAVTRAS
jgi:hypothetical protein